MGCISDYSTTCPDIFTEHKARSLAVKATKSLLIFVKKKKRNYVASTSVIHHVYDAAGEE